MVLPCMFRAVFSCQCANNAVGVLFSGLMMIVALASPFKYHSFAMQGGLFRVQYYAYDQYSCCVLDADNILLPTFIQSSPQLLQNSALVCLISLIGIIFKKWVNLAAGVLLPSYSPTSVNTAHWARMAHVYRDSNWRVLGYPRSHQLDCNIYKDQVHFRLLQTFVL